MTEKKQNPTLVEHREAISAIVAAAAKSTRVPKDLRAAIARAETLLTRSRGKPATITPQQIVEMQSLRASGASYVTIGEKFGAKPNAVQMALRRASDKAAKTKPPPAT